MGRRDPYMILAKVLPGVFLASAAVLFFTIVLALSSYLSAVAAITPCPPEVPQLAERKAPPEPTPTPEPTPAPEETEPPYTGPVNPLTGLPMEEEWVGKRPIAIMLNNLVQAQPQLGQSQADIIYEALEEGGITRMMGVYQTLTGVGMVGSIRSSRTYYLELALPLDAIYIHAGGSDEPKYEDAYGKIKAWGVTSLDGVRGPYMSNSVEGALMWRDPARRRNNGSVHSVVTTGEKIRETLSRASFRTEHKEDYTYEMAFAADGTPQNGSSAESITIPFSTYKTGVFTYDGETKRYLVSQYGKPYVDGITGEQVGVTNVVIVLAEHKNTWDSYGHIKIDLDGSGEGYFACGGKYIPIRWEKERPYGQFYFTDLEGNELVFGQGKSYINIVPDDADIGFQ